MLPIKKKEIVLLLGKDYLHLYTKKLIHPRRIEFPPDTVKDFKIINKERFIELIVELFTSVETKNIRGLILLSEEMFSQKIITHKNSIQTAQETEQFLNGLPFSPDELIKKKVAVDNGCMLIAAHRPIFEELKNMAYKLGLNIDEVFAITAFKDINNHNHLTSANVRLILEAASSISKYNLLENDPLNNSRYKNLKVVLSNPVIIAVSSVVFLSIIFFIFFIMFSLKNQSKVTQSKIEVPQVGLKSNQESTPTTTIISYAPKEKLQIQILNGSGITGQANKIKNIFLKLGFNSIKTGNISISKSTEVSFKNLVDPNTRNEITLELQNMFKNLALKESTDSAIFDVVIKTGRD